MQITQTKDVELYTTLVEPLLLKKEACNNLSLGILQRFIDRKHNLEVENLYLGLVTENGRVIYSFLQTAPHNLILADIDGIDPNIIKRVAEFVYNQVSDLPGVLGPIEYTKEFVAHCSCEAQIQMNQLIYQLDQINPVEYPGGELVKASRDDKQLIAKWLVLFGKEATEVITHIQANQLAERFIENQSVYLWKVANTPVSMVNQSRRTRNGTTINGVFTPNEYKRNGYATAAVAKLSEKLLNEGYDFCSLYTDSSNPTANNIYQKIGFKVVGKSTVYHFNDL
ncbi:GNAT family N-acetyltransferase [Aquibacillus saliphilus]|uniref:GNAT family N-acetyltransferase n=1 Tax=Aquibacillus saliphilus TaxID=1909422 RepID=UPI001CF0077F|nr:GNAT family N-acetyltransferase [Aquibacillus saliphilus]